MPLENAWFRLFAGDREPGLIPGYGSLAGFVRSGSIAAEKYRCPCQVRHMTVFLQGMTRMAVKKEGV